MSEYNRNPNTECVICDKPIYRRPSQIEQNEGNVFCSQRCYGLHCRKTSPCVVCNKAILAGSNKKTCSRKCANKNRSGIKYNVGQPKNKVKDLRALRKRLLKERGQQCENCGYGTYPILQIHHKDRNRGNNKLSNLELLCPNCHRERHYLKKH